MKKNKIFGIGAVVLMIFIAMLPAINGMQLNRDNDEDILQINTLNFDLEVIVEDCHFLGIDENGENVIYEITYHYENQGEDDFKEQELEHIMKNDNCIFNRWNKLVITTISKAKTKSVKETITIPAEKEEYLAGKEFFLEVITNDPNPDNDKGLGVGNFGWEGKDYAPTYAHIKNTMQMLSERLKNYETKEMGGLFTRLKERLGWVYTLYSYSTRILDWGLKLLREALLVGAAIIAEVYIILDWVVEFEAFLAAPNPLTLDVMLRDTAVAAGALIVIYDTLVMHNGVEKCKVVWQELSDAVNATEDYLKSRPWYNPIDLVFGDIDGKNLGSKTVHVSCRRQEADVIYNYDFDDLDAEAMGEKAWQIHDCTVTASVTGYKTKQSPKIVSWVFSEGKMRYDFYLKPDKARIIYINRYLNNILGRWLNIIKPSSIYFLTD